MGRWSNLTNIFRMGWNWNHQLAWLIRCFLAKLPASKVPRGFGLVSDVCDSITSFHQCAVWSYPSHFFLGGCTIVYPDFLVVTFRFVWLHQLNTPEGISYVPLVASLHPDNGGKKVHAGGSDPRGVHGVVTSNGHQSETKIQKPFDLIWNFGSYVASCCSLFFVQLVQV